MEWFYLITAKEAEQKSASARCVGILTEEDKRTLVKIKEMIDTAISKGETCCKCEPEFLTQKIDKVLYDKGYFIRYIGKDIFIDWSGKYENLI